LRPANGVLSVTCVDVAKLLISPSVIGMLELRLLEWRAFQKKKGNVSVVFEGARGASRCVFSLSLSLSLRRSFDLTIRSELIEVDDNDDVHFILFSTRVVNKIGEAGAFCQ